MVETKSRKSKKKKAKQASRSSPVAFFNDKVLPVLPFISKGIRDKEEGEETANDVTIDQQDDAMVLTSASLKKAPPSGDRKPPAKKKTQF